MSGEIYTYNIQVAPSVYDQILHNGFSLTYTSEEKAISAVEEAFQKEGVIFTIKKENDQPVFLNQHGGELARVVKICCGGWR